LVEGLGKLMKAFGPAFCSPLNGVGLVGSKPQGWASAGLLNQRPTWNVWGRQEARGWIEPEDLIKQDGFDRYFSFTVAVRFDVGLVPGQAKVLEIRIDSSFSQQIAVLNREEVECQVRNQVVNLQNQGVIESAPLDDHLGPKVFGHKGIDKPQRFPGARARRLSRCAGRRQAKD